MHLVKHTKSDVLSTLPDRESTSEDEHDILRLLSSLEQVGVSSAACSDVTFEKRNLRCLPALFVSHLTLTRLKLFSGVL
jgi:hypothetical protein